jgi:hypothetical protein
MNQLNKLLHATQSIGQNEDGISKVSVVFDHHEATWVATASWSNNHTTHSQTIKHINPVCAITKLISRMKDIRSSLPLLRGS